MRVPICCARKTSQTAVRRRKRKPLYPHPFHYHRATSIEQAVALLSQLGGEARLLAGGQSLIPLMKMRLARPSDLVDINFLPGLAGIQERNGELHLGGLARHADLEASEIAARIPIIHDCAAGIADVQVRNQGTIGGSLSIALADFFKDAYTTVLGPAELLREIIVQMPPKKSGGAYLAFKRCAPVYASASAAVQLTLGDKDTCADARIVLGCVGLLPIRAKLAEAALRGTQLTAKAIETAAEAARAAAEPQSDMRGSAEYKRQLVATLVKRAIGIAARRARGEQVEATHEYVGR